MGTSDKPYRHFKDKELYGLDTINGYHQLRAWKPTQHLRETSANPHYNSWTTHLTKSWVGVKVGLVERTTFEWPKWRIGRWRMQQQASPDERSSGKGRPRWKHLSELMNAKKHLRNQGVPRISTIPQSIHTRWRASLYLVISPMAVYSALIQYGDRMQLPVH